MGRPTKYKAEYVKQAQKACEAGFTDDEVADLFGVSRSTLALWKLNHQEFSDALKTGKDVADERVERSLYHRATGYTFDAVKIFNHQGAVIEAPYKEHVPPDTTAMIFWLKNRRPAEWRDKRDIEHSGEIGITKLERKIVDK